MKRSRIPVIALCLAVVLASALMLAGCPQRGDQAVIPTNTTEPGATTTERDMVEVTLYFIKSQNGEMFLVPEKRSIPRTQAIASATLEELIEGPEGAGLTSVIPRDTEVRSIVISDELATVDFSAEVLNANVGARAEELGIWQIVNTLTQFDSIDRVAFRIEGKEEGTVNGREIQDWWGHVGLHDQPFEERDDLVQGGMVSNDQIRVESPRAFTTIANPVTVRGQARVFEAQFHARVLDADGTVLADVPVLADDFDWGDFNKEIRYTAPRSENGTVFFYFFSPKDGSERAMGSVPVFFR